MLGRKGTLQIWAKGFIEDFLVFFLFFTTLESAASRRFDCEDVVGLNYIKKLNFKNDQKTFFPRKLGVNSLVLDIGGQCELQGLISGNEHFDFGRRGYGANGAHVDVRVWFKLFLNLSFLTI